MFRVYRRVSTNQQDTRSQDLELNKWVSNRVDVMVYPAEKMTGTKMERPIFNQLLKDCQMDDSIVVWRLDRLGRSASGLTRLFDELIARKVNLISLRDGVDLFTPSGKLIAGVLASVAEFEH